MEYVLSAAALLVALVALGISGLARRDARMSAGASERSARAAEHAVASDETDPARCVEQRLRARIVFGDWSKREGAHVQNAGTGTAHHMRVFLVASAEDGVARSVPVDLAGGSDTRVSQFAPLHASELSGWETDAGPLPARVTGTVLLLAEWTNDDRTKDDSGWTYRPRE